MNYLLDTCVISDFFKKIPPVVDQFKLSQPSQLHISTITLMEIDYGLLLHPEREKKIRPLWEALISHVQLVPFSNNCAKEAANIRAELKTAGTLIGPYDILIAGTAKAYDLIVVTSNLKKFSRIKKIEIEDWRIRN